MRKKMNHFLRQVGDVYCRSIWNTDVSAEVTYCNRERIHGANAVVLQIIIIELHAMYKLKYTVANCEGYVRLP